MGDKQTWENDNGLVIRREPDGSVSFDIFDADEWNGGIEEGRTIAALIVRAVNHHEELVTAVKSADLMIAELVDWFTSDPEHEVSVAADAEVTQRVIRVLRNKVEDP